MEPDAGAAAALHRDIGDFGDLPALFRPRQNGLAIAARNRQRGDDLVVLGGQLHPGHPVAGRALRVHGRRIDAQNLPAPRYQGQVVAIGQHPRAQQPGDVTAREQWGRLHGEMPVISPRRTR